MRMAKTTKKKTRVTASARVEDARISLKSSGILCKEIRGKKVERVKAMLEGLVAEKHSLRGKYYTKTAKKFLEVVKSAEANAKAKMLDDTKLFVISARADKGRTFVRPRSRMGRRGERAKMTHLEIIVGEK